MTQADANYVPPKHSETIETHKVSRLIIFFAIILSVFGALLGYAMGVGSGIGQDGRIGELIGQSVGIIIFGLLVVAVFQLIKQFRNQRS